MLDNLLTLAQKEATTFYYNPEEWIYFDDFSALSKANETAADRLIQAAKSADPSAMMSSLRNLGGSCKACHKLYKD